jgi:hypothetical protein
VKKNVGQPSAPIQIQIQIEIEIEIVIESPNSPTNPYNNPRLCTLTPSDLTLPDPFILRNQRVETRKGRIVKQGRKPLTAPALTLVVNQAFRDQGDHLVFGIKAGQFPGQAGVPS